MVRELKVGSASGKSDSNAVWSTTWMKSGSHRPALANSRRNFGDWASLTIHIRLMKGAYFRIDAMQ